MIRTVEVTQSSYKFLKCFQVFEETMSTSDWEIERVKKYLFKKNHFYLILNRLK